MSEFKQGDRVRYRPTDLDLEPLPPPFEVQAVRQWPWGMDATAQQVLTPDGWRWSAWFELDGGTTDV